MEKEITFLQAGKENKKDRTFYDVAVSVLYSSLLMAGVSELLGDLIPFQGNQVLFAVSTAAAVLVIFSQQQKMLEVVLPLLLLFGAFALLFFRMEAVIRGMLALANMVMEKWNTIFNTYLPLYGLASPGKGDIFSALIILGILLGIFSGYSIWRQWLGFLTAEVFLLVMTGCLLRGNESCRPVILLMAGWLGIWSGSRTGSRRSRRISLCVCAFTLVFGWGTSALLSGYHPARTVDNIRTQIEDAIEYIRFGTDSLPQGDLRRAGTILGEKPEAEEEEKRTLELSFDTPQEMYLRGFVGAQYDGQSWRQLSVEAYTGRQEGMLDWLGSHGYNPVFARASSQEADAGGQDGASGQTFQNVEVVNRGADRRYVYVPETVEAVEGADYKINQDWQLVSGGIFGEKEYQFQNLQIQPAQEFPKAPSWLKRGGSTAKESYIEAEEVYRSFVYDYYLTVDEDVKQEIDRLFFSGEKWKEEQEDAVDLYEATARIRVMLAALAEYSPETAEVPEGKDFVTWFLGEHKEGNAVHFATAAVIAYRTLGIPARYAEGYYLNGKLAEQLMEQGADSCQLTQENGHAWAEVYVDGVGWSPVEVTPGFYSEVYAPDYLINIRQEEMEKGNSGARTEVDEVVSGNREEKRTQILPYIPWNMLGIALLVLLLIVGIIVLLEMQRIVRVFLRSRKRKNNPDKLAELSYGQMCRMFRCAGVPENYRHPYELTECVCTRFSSIKEEEYIRVIQIIQRNIFGQKALLPNECRILEVLCGKIRTELYADASLWKKLLYRYLYCH